LCCSSGEYKRSWRAIENERDGRRYMTMPTFHATTILAVRRDGKVALGETGR
jgi:hypothetical protein